MENGLSFVYLDVNIFDSPACMRIRRKYGNEGLAVFIRLLLEVAKNGYFLPWDEEKPLDLIDTWRMKEEDAPMIQGVVNDCLNTRFYSREVYEVCGVLTGEQVQENFKTANARRKRPLCINARYWLISRDDMPACVTFSDGEQGRPLPTPKQKKQEATPRRAIQQEAPEREPMESTPPEMPPCAWE